MLSGLFTTPQKSQPAPYLWQPLLIFGTHSGGFPSGNASISSLGLQQFGHWIAFLRPQGLEPSTRTRLGGVSHGTFFIHFSGSVLSSDRSPKSSHEECAASSNRRPMRNRLRRKIACRWVHALRPRKIVSRWATVHRLRLAKNLAIVRTGPLLIRNLRFNRRLSQQYVTERST